jgi:hypothetical protein
MNPFGQESIMSQSTALWIASGLLLALVAAPVVAQQKPEKTQGLESPSNPTPTGPASSTFSKGP